MIKAPRCPSNWYIAMPSSKLARGGITEWSVAGRSLIIYRGNKDGRVRAFAGHCAHLGSHLKYAAVVGDGFRCAMHHRLFDGDGKCVHRRDGTLIHQQRSYPVREKFGAIFVYLGEGEPPELPEPELASHESPVTRVTHFYDTELGWPGLVANAVDLEHLGAVHKRAAKTLPLLERPAPHMARLSYESQVIGIGLIDRATRWISGNRIELTMTTLGGTMVMVETKMKNRHAFLILSLVPQPGRTVIHAITGAGSGFPGGALKVRISNLLYRLFLKRDIVILDQMRMHRPIPEANEEDRILNQYFDYLEELSPACPEFERNAAT